MEPTSMSSIIERFYNFAYLVACGSQLKPSNLSEDSISQKCRNFQRLFSGSGKVLRPKAEAAFLRLFLKKSCPSTAVLKSEAPQASRNATSFPDSNGWNSCANAESGRTATMSSA